MAINHVGSRQRASIAASVPHNVNPDLWPTLTWAQRQSPHIRNQGPAFLRNDGFYTRIYTRTNKLLRLKSEHTRQEPASEFWTWRCGAAWGARISIAPCWLDLLSHLMSWQKARTPRRAGIHRTSRRHLYLGPHCHRTGGRGGSCSRCIHSPWIEPAAVMAHSEVRFN